ncbi:hypothetical protein CEUSTIGMA_g4464.t1 [Chlamydomonas eustigma]|uniref:Glycosyl transferase CAP10 domain-containing protein n=1 Tax=Chlamydomonas eustigma TaxID=1157962 RepID=A0A250X1Q7_9CHLO|nr:hypothetical protein CEUSTIGMA_g4464.t1 [Chlamydomonas eustigma]|eukprot:GAX77017.1 hypothetical protein CEUSTIGMA_g4464.t1 [Chlamydomonas eustigma]
MEGWTINSRPIPSALPARSVTDWDMRTGVLTEARHIEEDFFACPFWNLNEKAPIYRYKFFNGIWYSDFEHIYPSPTPVPYHQYREPFVAALLFASWLYKDFPQMDFVADFADHSRVCVNATVLPYIKYSSLDLEAVSTTAKGKHGLHYDATGMVNRRRRLHHVHNKELHGNKRRDLLFEGIDAATVGDGRDILKVEMSSEHTDRERRNASRASFSAGSKLKESLPISELPIPDRHVAMNRGFVIPTPEAWNNFCWDEVQLEYYLNCINERYPWPLKEDVVFWRGSTSGRQYMFPDDLGLEPEEEQQFPRKSGSQPSRPYSVFGNKRVMMAIMSQQYSFLDIGITDPGGMKHIWYPAIADQIQKPGVELPRWGASTITVSIDGHGPPYRLPFQLLGGSVTLVQKSPHVTWLEAYKDDLWKPGVHYESFEYDLSDFVTKARELVHRPREQLQAMAEAAQKSGVELLNVFSMLDSIMWSLMRVKEVSQWEVRPPRPGSVWKVVKIKKGEWCKFAHGVPSSVKSAIEDRFASNFLPVEENLENPVVSYIKDKIAEFRKALEKILCRVVSSRRGIRDGH